MTRGRIILQLSSGDGKGAGPAPSCEGKDYWFDEDPEKRIAVKNAELQLEDLKEELVYLRNNRVGIIRIKIIKQCMHIHCQPSHHIQVEVEATLGIDVKAAVCDNENKMNSITSTIYSI